MNFKKITPQDIERLISFTSRDRVFTAERIHEDFTHDEMTEYGAFSPDVVVEALSADEISSIMRYANENNIAVTPRGAGTGLCGACVPIYGGIVLSTAKMNHVLEIDKNTMTVITEPGVLLMELAKTCLNEGLLYPPDPGEKSATVGGNVMTNAGGMRAVKYGVTRDYVRGIEAVLPSGEIVTFGGRLSKNSSGYSLKDLLIGSEGTLAVVTKLYLKVIPAPKRMTSLLIPFDNIEQCLAAVPLVMGSPEIPTTLEFMEREVILDAQEYLGKKFPDNESDAYLIVSFSGNSKKEIAQHYEYVAQVCLQNGAKDVFISDTEERQESIWSTRGAFLEAIKSSTPSMDECDVVVQIDKVCEFLGYIKSLSKEYDIRIRSFGHAGDGNLHVYLCQDDLDQDRWAHLRELLMKLMYEKAAELSGMVSGEHGIGHAKKEFLLESLGPHQVALMQGIKKVFDPKGILNPGKVI